MRCVVGVLCAALIQTGCESSAAGTRHAGADPDQAIDPQAMNNTAGTPAAPGLEAGSAPAAVCTAAELASACAAQQCGLSEACEQSCGVCADGEVCQQGACMTPEALCAQRPETCECLSLDFSIPTRQSCSISLPGADAIDAEGFIEADGGIHRVLAINRWGKGHLIAWCDASTSDSLLKSFAALAYLGRKADPTFASFGDSPMCDGDFGVEDFAQKPVYLGADLPERYLGDPAQLAADWDVIMFCGAYTSWNPEWPPLLQAYVTEYGRGLFVAMDYQGWDYKVEDFSEMNRVLSPSGIAFDPVELSWADASVEVAVECLPDLTEAVLL